jgi:hypothetical protein
MSDDEPKPDQPPPGLPQPRHLTPDEHFARGPWGPAPEAVPVETEAPKSTE